MLAKSGRSNRAGPRVVGCARCSLSAQLGTVTVCSWLPRHEGEQDFLVHFLNLFVPSADISLLVALPSSPNILHSVCACVLRGGRQREFCHDTKLIHQVGVIKPILPKRNFKNVEHTHAHLHTHGQLWYI